MIFTDNVINDLSSHPRAISIDGLFMVEDYSDDSKPNMVLPGLYIGTHL